LTVAGCRLGPTFDAFLGSARVRRLDLEEVLNEMDFGEEPARLGQLAANPHIKDLGFDIVLSRDVFPLLGPGLETLRLTCTDDINDASLCEYIAARGQGLTTFEMDERLPSAAMAAFPRTLRHLNTILDSDEAWIRLGELVNLETLTVLQGCPRTKPPPVRHLHGLTRLRQLSLDVVRVKTTELRTLCDCLSALESLDVSWPTSDFEDQDWFAKFKT